MKRKITRQGKTIQSLRHSQVLETEFLIQPMASCVLQTKDWMNNALRTDAFMILWFYNPVSRIQVDEQEIAITRDTILFMRKDRVYVMMDENYDGIAITFTENFFCITPGDATFLHNSTLFRDLQRLPHINVTAGDTVFSLLVELLQLENASENKSSSRLVIHNLLQHFIIAAERKLNNNNLPDTTNKASDLVTAFLQLLDRDYRSVRSVSAYATALSLTEKRLHAATSALLGKTPKQVIDEKIMLEAGRLLTHSSKTTSEIAFDLGFQQVSNFVKYFRKHTGVTPAVHRKSAIRE